MQKHIKERTETCGSPEQRTAWEEAAMQCPVYVKGSYKPTREADSPADKLGKDAVSTSQKKSMLFSTSADIH